MKIFLHFICSRMRSVVECRARINFFYSLNLLLVSKSHPRVGLKDWVSSVPLTTQRARHFYTSFYQDRSLY